MEVPLKTEISTTIWPSNPTPGHIDRENHDSKIYTHPSVHWSTVYNSQDMEATWTYIHRGIDKKDVVHIYYVLLISH